MRKYSHHTDDGYAAVLAPRHDIGGDKTSMVSPYEPQRLRPAGVRSTKLGSEGLSREAKSMNLEQAAFYYS